MQFDKALVIDDDPIIRRILVSSLSKLNMPVLAVSNCRQALEEQTKDPADLVIADLQLPDGTGLQIIEQFKKLNKAVEIIIVTGFGTIQSAVDAMKLGASNYLLKPFTSSQLELALAQLATQKELRQEIVYLKDQMPQPQLLNQLCSSPGMKQVTRLIQHVAPTDATVLITGESGTGKEVVARTIFQMSSRNQKPYVQVNCAAVPNNLLESEFFGHEKGAFTGAANRRIGRFEQANDGTLLLDEVTEIPLSLQAKLLRVLQEHEFERVGGNRTISCNVRILATTNRDLSKAVAAGEFRSDLFYRLNVVSIPVPRLIERPGEVESLLLYFLDQFALQHNRTPPTISPLVLEQLATYPWPGNVRELKNYAERAIILSAGKTELTYADIIPNATDHDAEALFGQGKVFPTLAELEKRLIFAALKHTKGNRNQAATMIGINVRTLRNKMKEYEGLDDEESDGVYA